MATTLCETRLYGLMGQKSASSTRDNTQHTLCFDRECGTIKLLQTCYKLRESDNVHTMIQCSTLCTQRKVTIFPCFWCLVFGAQFQHFLDFFCPFFCYAVSSCVYYLSHPYLVSECLFLAENKAFPYPRRLRAHPRRLDAAATCSVVIFVVVAEKRSRNLSVSWLTLYGLVDRLPVLAGNFRRALQRHFLVDFQTEDIAGKIFSSSKRAYFALVNRARNG